MVSSLPTWDPSVQSARISLLQESVQDWSTNGVQELPQRLDTHVSGKIFILRTPRETQAEELGKPMGVGVRVAVVVVVCRKRVGACSRRVARN